MTLPHLTDTCTDADPELVGFLDNTMPPEQRIRVLEERVMVLEKLLDRARRDMAGLQQRIDDELAFRARQPTLDGAERVTVA